MKRKNYSEKKNAIQHAANALFLEQGYESTSVDQILNSLNISKGTFYHYFDSKAELLESIINDFTASFVTHLEPLVGDNSLTALAKLNAFYLLNQTMKEANQGFFLQVISAWYQDNNLIYKHRLDETLINRLTPYLERILIQGKDENVFDIINPSETAVLIAQLGINLRDRMVQEVLNNGPNLEAIVRTYERSIERILGIPSGSLVIFSREFIVKS